MCVMLSGFDQQVSPALASCIAELSAAAQREHNLHKGWRCTDFNFSTEYNLVRQKIRFETHTLRQVNVYVIFLLLTDYNISPLG